MNYLYFHHPKNRIFQILILFFLISPITAYSSEISKQAEIKLLMGGDISWSLSIRPHTVRFDEDPLPDDDWRSIPLFEPNITTTKKLIEYNLHFSSEDVMVRYPFQKILPILRDADIIFFNLETPLSDGALMMGLSRTPTLFAKALHDIGTSVVTIANNHTHDADIPGFLHTTQSLKNANVPFVGGGNNIAEARKPVILEQQGIKVGFIGYSQFSNRGEPAFASFNRPGIAPMDPNLIKEDIIKLRPKVDYLIVSIHWGTDKSPNVSNANRKLAHHLIDAGADIIFGHHTPFPKGIEVYKKKIIIYSPSHVFIGHNYAEWGDNYMVRFTLNKNNFKKIEIIPIAGTGIELAQPFLLSGYRANQLLNQIRDRSHKLNTEIQIKEDMGIIDSDQI